MDRAKIVADAIKTIKAEKDNDGNGDKALEAIGTIFGLILTDLGRIAKAQEQIAASQSKPTLSNK